MKIKPSPRRSTPLLVATCLGLMVGATTAPKLAHAQDDKKVVTPKNVNPNEEYNLPPNFDPEYRPKRTPGNIKVTIDFRQAQLEEVVKFYSSMMNKNFIISDSLQANKTITIISPKPVSINEAYRAFLAALQMNGLTIIPMGSFLKIVAAKDAIKEPVPPVDAGKYIPNDGRVVTAIIPVENASVDEIQQIVQKFLTPDANMITYGNSLIITENGANLRRIRDFIKKLDKSSATNRVFVYKVGYADASEIQERLNEIFGVGGATASANAARTTRNNRRNTNTASTAKVESGDAEPLDVDITEIIADERTNQLFIISDERSFNRIKQMIELLDVPTAVGGEIHVKSLEYANAEDLASTLSGLASSSRSTSSSSRTNTSRRTTNQRSAAPVSANGGVAQLLQGDVQITAHKATNSLIIIASPRDYVALDRVVGILDRPRRQVYVEAVIMEIGLDVNRQLGIGVNGGAPSDLSGVIPQSAVDDGLVNGTDGLVLGQVNFGSGFSSVLGGTGGAIGMIGPSINIPGVDVSLPAFALFLQATQTDNSVNVLSTPSIMTLDNEEAEIVVGDRVPIPRGGGGLGNVAGLLGGQAGQQLGGAASLLGGLGGGLLGQIDYEDVGITLRILPQVNQSNYVRLEVDQEVSDIKGAGSQNSNLGPTRTKRSIKNVVMVKDQSTIVIGGLIRDVENETEEKVPFFGDVPLIGLLFKNKTSLKTKQNLVLMLTPYIIESEADLRKIYDRKKREREELLKLFLKRDINYMRSVNYDKKSGLLDRMRTQIGGAVTEKIARDEAAKAFEDNTPRYRVLGEPEDAVNGANTDGATPEATPDAQAPETPQDSE